jgi:hypothetical protein
MLVSTLFSAKQGIHQAENEDDGGVFTKNIENKTKKRKKKKMAKKFFPDEWEKISAEEMIRARARLSGFIESIPEKDKAIRDVSIKR